MTTVMTAGPLTTDDILDIARQEIDSLDRRYQIYPGVRVNPRLSRCAGRSFYTFGRPYQPKVLIELCKHFHMADREQLVDTVRHEYAHLLVRSRHSRADVDGENLHGVGVIAGGYSRANVAGENSHGPLWQAAAVECGADPTGTYPQSLFSAGYRAYAHEKPVRRFNCPHCDNYTESRRRPARNFECLRCGTNCEFFIEVSPEKVLP